MGSKSTTWTSGSGNLYTEADPHQIVISAPVVWPV